MKAVKGTDMKKIDEYTIKNIGIPGIILMENAAKAVVNEISKEDLKEKNVLVFCGSGNNGGDGFAVARLLHHISASVTVITIGEVSKIKGDAKINYDIICNLNINKINVMHPSELEEVDRYIETSSIIVDAIFGTGCFREVTGIYSEVISKINESKKKVYSVDIPSGINSDNGKMMGIAVKAYKTITFALPKIGLFFNSGINYSGEVIVADIGIPLEVINSYDFEYEIIDDSYKNFIPKRIKESHKGSYGKILSITGSKSMVGASILSTIAAYKSGSGLVNVLTEAGNEACLFQACPEAIVNVYNRDIHMFSDKLDVIKKYLENTSIILIGCGIGQDLYSKKMFELVLSLKNKKIVIDADGLTLLSENLSILGQNENEIIITPHIGEMSRLTGHSTNEILENPLYFAENFSNKYNVITVLKSHRTVITGGDKKIINLFGNSGMATAGSGDVLAGIITSMLGQGLEPLKAATVGVYIHSKAGDVAKELKGEHGLIARDIINAIPNVMR